MPRRFEPLVEQPRYQLNGRLHAFYQHLGSNVRKLPTPGNAEYANRLRAFASGARGTELRRESVGDEGWGEE